MNRTDAPEGRACSPQSSSSLPSASPLESRTAHPRSFDALRESSAAVDNDAASFPCTFFVNREATPSAETNIGSRAPGALGAPGAAVANFDTVAFAAPVAAVASVAPITQRITPLRQFWLIAFDR